MDAVVPETQAVRVEFLGLFSPYAHPDVMKALAAPARTLAQRREQAAIRRELTKQERKRQMQGFARVQGRVKRTIGPESGLSRSYTWGPRTWIVEMDPHDAEVLMRLHPAHKLAFRIHDDVIVISR